MVNPALRIFDQHASDIINTNFDIELLDSSCSFSEGPVWSGNGHYLFSDIPKNVIFRIDHKGTKKIYIEESGCTLENKEFLSHQIGSNGLTFDLNKTLLICQHGNGAVAKYESGIIVPFISSYGGKRFNSPNDLVVHPAGAIFFSDPPYGLKEQKLNKDKAQPVAGIYCYRDGVIDLFCDQFQYPNGLCLSPGGESLYCCSNKPFERFVLEFDSETLMVKRNVCAENGDGIKCDRRGNIFLCTKEGILIINEAGKRLALISLSTIPANCCWGGDAGNDLFITARENIFLIRGLQK